MNNPIQSVITYCIRPDEANGSNFSYQIAEYVDKLREQGAVIKSVSTTSYTDCGKVVIAYTFLIEK